MSGLNLWLVRHGETEVNSGIWSVKPGETRLTSLGRKQAECAAAQVVKAPDLFVVSPLIRAQETLSFFIQSWPFVPVSVFPMQEFIYLSPERLVHLDKKARTEQVKEYWLRGDPYYCDGDGAESFASFLERVAAFHTYVLQQKGFVIAVGHGQFFKAFLLGLEHGFEMNRPWMAFYREKETQNPLKNGEIIQLCLN